MKLSYAVAGFASLLSVATASNAPFTIGSEVKTTSGTVCGHAAANRTQVSEYLGIPFAEPPVNDLRFAAPKPYRNTTHFNASSFGASCLMSTTTTNFSVLLAEGYHMAPTAEQFAIINSEIGLPLSEDCLTLNIWTKPQTGEEAKAVLFFIYGGGEQHVCSANCMCLTKCRVPRRLHRQHSQHWPIHRGRRRRGRHHSEVRALLCPIRLLIDR